MNNQPLVFGKRNYQILIASLFLIALGYVLMSLEKGEYGIGTLGITVGPMIVLAGFGLTFWAILYKDKTKK
ncbi:MAG TPA: hypothetical protein VK750_10655 [Cytophagaceae bacterium]|jgi:hypothetical protein|nr:hypothetical protein [Cytophagaceae bacterium]